MAYSGKFIPVNKGKYKGNYRIITFRSSWEYSFFKWADKNPNVICWSSEEVVIPYFSSADNKNRRYFMDIYIKFTNGKEFLFEIKPHCETMPPKPPKRKTDKSQRRFLKQLYTFQVNTDKWNEAQLYSIKRGYEFRILTEHSLKKLIGLRIS